MKESIVKILLVEDDKNLGYILKDFLEISKYEVTWAEDGAVGMDYFNNNEFDICLLDVMLPFKDGFTIAEEIRKKNTHIPIIFLTAKNMQEDKIKGFKIGGDDYITKPFSTQELILRIQAILKRTKNHIDQPSNNENYTIGKFKFDFQNQILIFGKEERQLTKKEASVLRLLCINKNKILRRDVALQKIWGANDYFMGRSMDVYITKLRKILKDDPNISITNVHRTGFKLEIK